MDKRRTLTGLLFGAVALAVAIRGPVEWRAYQDRQLKAKTSAQLETYVTGNPKDANGKYYLALAYVREGKIEKAPRYFREALLIDPVRPEILNDLGATYLVQRRYYESLVALQGAISAKADYAPAWANLGRLHIAMDMAYTAVNELKKANELRPRDPEVLCDLGEAYLRTLNYRGCEASYREALTIQPDLLRAFIGMAQVFQEKGLYDDALKYIGEAEKLAPDDPVVLATLGSIHLKSGTTSGKYDKAIAYLTKAVEKDPNQIEAWVGLANILLQQNKPAEALEPLDRALGISPNHMGALNLVERALRRSGRTAEADRVAKVFKQRALWEREETVMEERTMRNADDWDAVARLAELYLQLDKRYKAIWLTNRLKDNAPYHPKLPKLLQAIGPNALLSPGAPGGGS